MNPVLKVEGLKKSYGTKEAVKGIDFEVQAGEIFALIGPNGAGKTTTLRIVATLLTISDGKVTFLGHDLKKEPEKVRERISYLPEEAGAYRNMKGADYLRFMANFYAGNGENADEIVKRGMGIADLGTAINDKVG
ncbi:MAG TPA: ABC transporter ATP-binding protein, partial [Terriglobales bacterium]|nr:ABC transporter ATP-binding protein [Terriglobales bacterium]